MAGSPPRPSAAGGFLIAAGVLGGAIIGFVLRQPTAGLLIGAGLGTAAALALWAIDRRR